MMKKINWLLFLEKFTFSLFILTVFLWLVNTIGLGMNLFNLRFILTITILLTLFYFFLRLESFGFDLAKFGGFIKDKFSLFSKISQKYQVSLIFKRLLDWLIIPLFLIILGLSLFLNNVLHQEDPFSVLIQSQNKSMPIYGKSGEILAGEKITSEFKAIDDNLGMVAVRFATFNRINSDVIIFRVKEKWAQDWYYENKYKVDQFQPFQLFPFGFPIIQNSKDKIYQFEIESTKGMLGDAVSITGPLPVFQAKYQFSKEKIFSNSEEKLIFAHKKIINLMSNREFSITSVIFFYPFFFYFLWYFISRKYLRKNYMLVYFVFLGILLDGLLVTKINNQANLLLILLWILAIAFHKINYKFSVFASLFCLLVCFFLSLFNNNIGVSKIGNWIYFFLLIAMAQLFLVYLSERLKNAMAK
jgi:hypothetical protein